MARLLICGDSFSTPGPDTWADSLKSYYDLTNVSQAGASEYRVWLQWIAQDLDRFDQALICHTSCNRIYSERNFFHDLTGKHKNCDLLYLDVKSHLPKPEAEHITWFFENVFDLGQAEFQHELMLTHWLSIQCRFPVTHISFFENTIDGVHNYHDVWKYHPGSYNHLSVRGNAKILALVREQLQNDLSFKDVGKTRG